MTQNHFLEGSGITYVEVTKEVPQGSEQNNQFVRRPYHYLQQKGAAEYNYEDPQGLFFRSSRPTDLHIIGTEKSGVIFLSVSKSRVTHNMTLTLAGANTGIEEVLQKLELDYIL
ncbi:MAG: hypothetical protein ABIH82_04620 [Candidatus Woesearchaeota archaeon]